MAAGNGGFYGQVLGSVFSDVGSLLDDTKQKETWNESYDAWSENIANTKTVENAISANEANLSQLGQEKILRRNRIRMGRDDVVAQKKVLAAWAGVEGNTVDNNLVQADTNMGLAIGQDDTEYKREKQQYLDRARQLRYSLSGIPKVRARKYKSPVLSGIGKAAGLLGNEEFMNRVGNMIDSWKGDGK